MEIQRIKEATYNLIYEEVFDTKELPLGSERKSRKWENRFPAMTAKDLRSRDLGHFQPNFFQHAGSFFSRRVHDDMTK